MKSIREIAEEIGVSKQAIRDKIALLGLQQKLCKQGNQFVINEKQEKALKQAFPAKTQTIEKEKTQTYDGDLQFCLQLLEKQNEQFAIELRLKDEQIKELTETNKKLHEEIEKNNEHIKNENIELVNLIKQVNELQRNSQILLANKNETNRIPWYKRLFSK